MIGAFNTRLDEEYDASKSHLPNRADWLDGRWTGLAVAPAGDRRGETALPAEILKSVGHALTTVPDGFHIHRTVARQLEAKAKMFETGEGFDWATGEALAFGTLLKEGVPVRLSGQDSSRGTFSQRHSDLRRSGDRGTLPAAEPCRRRPGASSRSSTRCCPKKRCSVSNTAIRTAEPKALVLWEAQFGDFANGAQVVIDQFIASGEMKWLRMCGLVMLLPHGYEGQGPEHSSARLERYLQLCAQDNIQVCCPTTPANYFHVLRRQIHRPFRKPLILMTPKSLLRHKRCVSFLSDMTPGSSFHRVFRDQAEAVPGATTVKLVEDAQIKRVILCTGKVYFDLMEEREKRGENRIQILRLEQLYPFPDHVLALELNRFPKADLVWCQEEPKNQGAWAFVAPSDRRHRRPSGRQHASALRWTARICVHRRGPVEPAQCGTENVSERGADAMSIEIKVPAMGESVTEATVARWFKKEGDSVARDEPLLELETDKVTVEVPAPASGAIESISVKAGDTVQVGAILGAIAEGKAGAPSVVAASNPDSAAPKPAPPNRWPRRRPTRRSATPAHADTSL